MEIFLIFSPSPPPLTAQYGAIWTKYKPRKFVFPFLWTPRDGWGQQQQWLSPAIGGGKFGDIKKHAYTHTTAEGRPRVKRKWNRIRAETLPLFSSLSTRVSNELSSQFHLFSVLIKLKFMLLNVRVQRRAQKNIRHGKKASPDDCLCDVEKK